MESNFSPYIVRGIHYHPFMIVCILFRITIFGTSRTSVPLRFFIELLSLYLLEIRMNPYSYSPTRIFVGYISHTMQDMRFQLVFVEKRICNICRIFARDNLHISLYTQPTKLLSVVFGTRTWRTIQ